MPDIFLYPVPSDANPGDVRLRDPNGPSGAAYSIVGVVSLTVTGAAVMAYEAAPSTPPVTGGGGYALSWVGPRVARKPVRRRVVQPAVAHVTGVRAYATVGQVHAHGGTEDTTDDMTLQISEEDWNDLTATGVSQDELLLMLLVALDEI